MFDAYEEFNVAKSACRECPVGKVYDNVVLSDGCKSPKILVLGEAPGKDEVIEGRPFVGKAGKLLRSTLNLYGYNDKNSIISNVIPCRPENNKFPKDKVLVKDCVDRWLRREIELLKPSCLLLLGAQPLKYVLGKTGITKIRGDWYNTLWDSNVKCMPTFHPSYVLRKKYMKEGKEIEASFINDIKMVAVEAGIYK